MAERTVTMAGNPLPLAGSELKPGDKAPDFRLVEKTPDGVKEIELKEFAGTTVILSVVPSIDTPVCEMQTMRFNQEIADLKGKARILTVSMDLPFAQDRFAIQHGAGKIRFGSDHRDASFGKAYGTLIEPLRLESRALFVVGPDGTLRHVEYVPEVTDQPDYDAALAAARSE